jgi:hypothetical protein
MAIIQLHPAPKYPVATSFQLRRNAWSRELITATVETARWTEKCGFIYTLRIDSGKRYGHWRVLFEYQILRQEVDTAIAA